MLESYLSRCYFHRVSSLNALMVQTASTRTLMCKRNESRGGAVFEGPLVHTSRFWFGGLRWCQIARYDFSLRVNLTRTAPKTPGISDHISTNEIAAPFIIKNSFVGITIRECHIYQCIRDIKCIGISYFCSYDGCEGFPSFIIGVHRHRPRQQLRHQPSPSPSFSLILSIAS